MTDLLPTYPLAEPTTAGALADRLVETVVDQLTQLEASTAPGLVLPGVFAGHAVVDDTLADLLYVVGLLHECGVNDIGGHEVTAAVEPLLRRIQPADTEGFASYRVGETILAFGGIDALPGDLHQRVLDTVDSPNVVAALNDPTAIPPNFAVVATRCLRALNALGGEASDLDGLLGRVRSMFDQTHNGWIDDGMADWVHYDIYTPDMYLFAEPLADDIGPNWAAGLTATIDELDDLVQPGGSVVWGRSIGSLGMAITIELAAVAVSRQLPVDRARWLARADETLSDLATWFRSGVLASHQGRRTMSYRGPARRLQMTLDILGKLLLAAIDLRTHPDDPGADPAANWASADRLVVFDPQRNATAWTHRSPAMSFVLPTLFGFSTEYTPAPRGPGLLEQPTSGHPVMLPVISARRRDERTGAAMRPATLVPASLPTEVDHDSSRHQLTIRHEGWGEVGQADIVVGGSRSATYRVEGRTLVVDEVLTLEDPDALPGPMSITVAETAHRPLDVACDGGDVRAVDTSDIGEWHSFWGPLPRIHQVDLHPAAELSFQWCVTPRLRVGHTIHGHPYDKALYGPLAERLVIGGTGFPDAQLVRRLRDLDVLHVAWPEWWTGLDPEHTARTIGQVRATGTGIVWTQHNLLPHRAKTDEAQACYQLWAAAADAVIHHSEAGKARALDTFTYGVETSHHVIPHGHWGAFHQAHAATSRAEVEAAEGWPRAALRLGVIGAPRDEKDVQLVVDAVAASGRTDVQLVARVDNHTVVPDDSRIVAETHHTPTDTYLRRFRAFDAVVLPFTRSGMLTTGTAFDCIASGVPAITSNWDFFDETFAGADIRFGSTVDDLAACIDELTDDRLAAARSATLALQPDYEWDTIADRTAAVLEEVANRHA